MSTKGESSQRVTCAHTLKICSLQTSYPNKNQGQGTREPRDSNMAMRGISCITVLAFGRKGYLGERVTLPSSKVDPLPLLIPFVLGIHGEFGSTVPYILPMVPYSFPMVSRWFRMVPGWFAYGPPWFPFSFPMVSLWFQGGYVLVQGALKEVRIEGGRSLPKWDGQGQRVLQMRRGERVQKDPYGQPNNYRTAHWGPCCKENCYSYRCLGCSIIEWLIV